MARQRFILTDRGLVEVDPDWRAPPRSFHIVGDHHEPFRSMADGVVYDSKSRYRAELKARGYEEVACSVESRMQAEVDYAKPKMPELDQNTINHCADAIGFDFNRGAA